MKWFRCNNDDTNDMLIKRMMMRMIQLMMPMKWMTMLLKI